MGKGFRAERTEVCHGFCAGCGDWQFAHCVVNL